jgi:Tol biopolymer transport system component/photosystem II stability/assembly factor-like uncharacterized protein
VPVETPSEHEGRISPPPSPPVALTQTGEEPNRLKPPVGKLARIGLGLIGGLLGAVVGAAIGASLYTPDPNAFLDLGAIEYGFYGGLAGLLVGAIGLPLSVARFRRRGSRPVSASRHRFRWERVAAAACCVALIAAVVALTRGDSRPSLTALRGKGQIVFTVRGGGVMAEGGALWLMNADGSATQRSVVRTARATEPVWSADGRWIAFLVESVDNTTVYFVHPDGSGLWHVSAGETFNSGGGTFASIAWAPTRSRLVFTTARKIVLADPVHRRLRLLKVRGARHPTWSPDGTRIAFSGRNGVMTMQANGRGRRLVTTRAADDLPVWSPDGERIAFVISRPGEDEEGVAVVSADGSGLIRLPRSKSGEIWDPPAWSPDGTRIMFTVGYNGWLSSWSSIDIARSDGKGAVTEIPSSSHVWGLDPVWSADGKWLYFLRGTDTEGRELYVAAVDGNGDARRLSHTQHGVESFSLLRTRVVLRPSQTSTGSATSTAASQWARVNLARASVYSLAIDPADPRIIYAGISSGLVAKSNDGGRTWHAAEVAHGDSIDSLALNPTRTSAIYAGTDQGELYGSKDGGRTWDRLTNCPSCENGRLSVGAAEALILDPQQPRTMYVGGAGVFKSSDGGDDWAPATSGLPKDAQIFSLAIDPSQPQMLFAGGAEVVYRSRNGGASWRRLGLVGAGVDITSLAIDPRRPHTLYAGAIWDGFLGGTTGGAFKSSDGGKTWRPLHVRTGEEAVLAVDPDRSQVIYAAISSDFHARLQRSRDQGASWHTFGSPIGTDVLRVAIARQSHTLYVGTWRRGIHILRSDGSVAGR